MAIAPVDVSMRQSSTANAAIAGAISPGSLTVLQGSLLVLTASISGTGSPTMSTPAGWTLLQSLTGTTAAFYMWILPNATAGATNPSSTAAGTTVTGVVIAMFEFTQMGSNAAAQSSFSAFTAPAQLANIFANAGKGQQAQHMLYVYAISRPTATITPQNTILNWNAIQVVAGVQGFSLDLFWATNLSEENPDAYQYSSTGPAAVSNSQVINADTINSGLGGQPSASGLLSSAVGGSQIGAIFNTASQNAQEPVNVGGNAGFYVPQFFQGMIGG